MSGRDASELLILKAELKTISGGILTASSMEQVVKRERDGDEIHQKDCGTCAYWSTKGRKYLCACAKKGRHAWGKREAWKWCGAKEGEKCYIRVKDMPNAF